MKLPALTFALFALVPLTHARIVSLVVQNRAPDSVVTNSFSIAPYETAELISYPNFPGINDHAELLFEKSGMTFGVNWQTVATKPAASFLPLIITGPATIQLTVGNSGQAWANTGLATLRVTPEPYPPEQTVIALPGTNRTAVTLECSTNLINWVAATNGVYGPMPQAKFFRVKVDPSP